MGFNKVSNKKIILLNSWLHGIGGAERVTLEEEKYLRGRGFETYILTYDFREEVMFGQTYQPENICVFDMKYNSKNLLIRTIYRVLALRKKLRQIRPDIIITESLWDCVYVYFATLFTPFSYVAHIPATAFWYTDGLIKYALIHKKVFNKIRGSVIGHMEFVPPKPPKSGFLEKVTAEVSAIAIYLAARKAKKIFVLSNQMKWEINKLYGKEAIVLKAAFPQEIFDYKPKQDIKEKLALKDRRIILSVNRLAPGKRVDLLIKAFKQVSERFDDVFLIIGGVGPEEGKLKDLAKQLNLADKLRFVGYISEEELWDYYAGCDVFVHPFWREFGMAAYEALAFQRKMVWSTEMEIDDTLRDNKHIFAANPTVNDFARAIEKALITEVIEKNDLSPYTWENYFGEIIKEITAILRGN